MSYLKENFACIRINQPHLPAELGISPAENFELIIARSGAVSARLGKVLLHSQFDPVKEAQSLIQGKVQKNISAAIFFGFGLGYHVEEFIKSFPHIRILIFEPDPALFLKALEARSLASVLGNRNVKILTWEKLDMTKAEALIEELQKLPIARIQVIKLRSVYEKDQAYYEELEKAIRDFLAKKEVNYNTLNRFGKLWVKNLVKNMELLTTMPGVACLKDFFRDTPALILASGPSLDDIWEILPRLQERMLIISVDTSLKSCLERGVEPDFIIVVDPQYWNTRHIDGAHSTRSYLISESSTHPRIFNSLKLRGFFASSFFPLGNYFESLTGYKGKLGAGGSVATSAWDFARFAGCAPLYMAGLDLGFPGKQTHFRGAFFEERFHTFSGRLQPVEKLSFAYLQQADPCYAEAHNGTRVLTDKRMEIYRSWFETQAHLYPAVKTCNLSAGGIKIRGLLPACPAELIALPLIRDKINTQLARLDSFFSAESVEEKRGKLKAGLKELLADLDTLAAQARKGLQQTADIRRILAGGKTPGKALGNLDKIDQAILGLGSRIIVSFLLQPIIQSTMNEADNNRTPEEAITASERIYRELRDSALYHRELLQQAYKRL